ncbi:MAG: hypothetical protein COB77_05045 [Gammaproteobacteria bacterium]|nr:MAG: hypothetical protein COB77_05045 [Gammaproteobacteria bacterium]
MVVAIDKHKLKKIMFVILVLLVNTCFADASSKAYDVATAVFKYTSADGKITYSDDYSRDFSQVEKIIIALPPSQQHVNDSKQRYDAVKLVVEGFSIARAERQLKREQKELKRLQRLALINQVKPSVVNQYNYLTYPYRNVRKRPYQNKGMTFNPVEKRSSLLPLPSTSFASSYHR